jgi:hypothetical protein
MMGSVSPPIFVMRTTDLGVFRKGCIYEVPVELLLSLRAVMKLAWISSASAGALAGHRIQVRPTRTSYFILYDEKYISFCLQH